MSVVQLRAGTGRPLVLLHGFTQTVASWSTYVALVPTRAIWAVALPGHTRAGPVAPTFADNVGIIAEHLVGADLTGAHIIGYSMGARIALGLLTHEPRLAARATLIGVHPGLSDASARSRRRRDDARWAALLREHGIAAFVSAWQARPLWSSQASVSADALAAQRAERMTHDASALADALDVLGLGSMPAYDVGAIRCRLDLVVGALDDKFVRIAHDLVHTARNATLRVVAGAGHNVVLEAPGAVPLPP